MRYNYLENKLYLLILMINFIAQIRDRKYTINPHKRLISFVSLLRSKIQKRKQWFKEFIKQSSLWLMSLQKSLMINI